MQQVNIDGQLKKNGWKPVGCNSDDKRRQKLAWTNRLTKKQKKKERERDDVTGNDYPAKMFEECFFLLFFRQLRTPSTKGHTHSRTNVDKTQLFNTNVNSSLRDVKTFPPPRRTVPAHE